MRGQHSTPPTADLAGVVVATVPSTAARSQPAIAADDDAPRRAPGDAIHRPVTISRTLDAKREVPPPA